MTKKSTPKKDPASKRPTDREKAGEQELEASTQASKPEVPSTESEVDLDRETVRQRIETLQREVYRLMRQVGRPANRRRPEGQVTVLVCGLEGNRIGLPLGTIKEVVPFARLTALPEAPAWVPGLLTLRGETLPVIDLAARVARGARQAELSDLIVVVTVGEGRLGLVVQSVFDIETFAAEELRDPADDLPHAPYVSGVRSSSAEPILLIDLSLLVELSDLPETES